MMTDIYLDGKKLDVEDAEGTSTVKELVDALEKELLELRLCIMDMRVNGERLSEWRNDPILHKPISEYSDFRFTTVQVEVLAHGGVETLREYIRFIQDNIPACSTDLRMGRKSAEGLFASVFEGLIEVLKTMDALTKGVGRYDIDLFKQTPAVYCKSLMERLEELNSARSSNDMVLMADILEYELAPLITEMEEKVFRRHTA
ncbi:MAG: hypothetical protein HY889_04810 [Deltaproteobacteria bacterium]|nr:hypothetical protein [Deltaproteobacteria bacterium]